MNRLKVGLIGCGTIGNILACGLDEWFDFELVVIFDIKKEASLKLYQRLKNKPVIVDSFKEFLQHKTDLVVEAAVHKAVEDYSEKILENSNLMIMSTAAFVLYPYLYDHLRKIAKERGRKIYLPSGAIVGVDGVKSAVRNIEEVILTTTKNPSHIEQTDYLTKKGIFLKELKEKSVIFKGSAKKAASYFPNNLNVASTLSLSGIGIDKTKVILVSDPSVHENIHEIYVKGSFGEFKTRTKNVASPENPKTSYLAALSALATLYKINEPFQIGT